MNHPQGYASYTNNMEYFSTKCPTATMTDSLVQQQRVLYDHHHHMQQSSAPFTTTLASAASTSTEAAVSEALLALGSSSARPLAACPPRRVSTTGSPPPAAAAAASTSSTLQVATPSPQASLQHYATAVAGHHYRTFHVQQPAQGNTWGNVLQPSVNPPVLAPPKQLAPPKAPQESITAVMPTTTPTMYQSTSSPNNTMNQKNAGVVHPRQKFSVQDGAKAPVTKKARTVSPPPAVVVCSKSSTTTTTDASTSSSIKGTPTTTTEDKKNIKHNEEADISTGGITDSVSCVCPVCNRHIKGLGDHKVDWSQPVQGRQRAKTISSIKKHVKDFHENEPIWNVIVNSVDVVPTAPSSGKKQRSSNSSVCSMDGADSQSNNRIVTAPLFVTQALKKAALDQIPNSKDELRSSRWTEKMMDQRVGIAKGFIQFGGQEFLRNKECQDEMGQKINPKSLRNLAYSMLQTMYNDLMSAWKHHASAIEDAMATAPLGLLRNRFQLLFAAPDKWSESWYMDPSKYSVAAAATDSSSSD